MQINTEPSVPPPIRLKHSTHQRSLACKEKMGPNRKLWLQTQTHTSILITHGTFHLHCDGLSSLVLTLCVGKESGFSLTVGSSSFFSPVPQRETAVSIYNQIKTYLTLVGLKG